MKKIILLLLISISGFSQRTCGTIDKLQHLKDSIPGFAQQHQESMDYIYNPNNTQTLFRQPNSPTVVVTIPIVFHVLYKSATENISDAQIMSELAVLNKDFRKLNTDYNAVVPNVFKPFGADVEIQFCLATRTPTGATTTGITRKSVASTFNYYSNYYTAAGEPAWNTNKYLNVWIVGDFAAPNQLVLGFAYLPSTGVVGSGFDGLCIVNKYFGTTGTAIAPFNKGRTATHEIGHYFGLNHPWGDDGVACGNPYNSASPSAPTNDDRVADTPETNNPYYNCPTFPSNANACGTTTNGSMFMNYMDYVDDSCMAFFTNGQKTIIQNTMASLRLSLLTSNGCASLGLNDIQAVNAISVYPNPVSQFFMITSPVIEIDELEIFNTLGQLVKTQKLTQLNNKINIDDLSSGEYYLRIYGQGSFIKSDKIIKL